MFRKNSPQQQPGFFDSQQLMTPKMRERLQRSWAQTFREVILYRIPEKRFAVLYSEQDSRPNAPVNVIVAGDMLKSGFGWTDEELAERMGFDLLVRHALGLDDLGQEGPTLRTVYNLRRRVREYAAETGINLYAEVFNQITDEQLSRLQLKTGWQRMDSTQLLSHIARLNRLELVISVLQKGVKGLPAEQQRPWQEAEAGYLSKPAQNVCYRLKVEETDEHLVRVGELLVRLLAQLQAAESDEEFVHLVERALTEQYEFDPDNKVTLKAAEDIAADSLQSPYDPQATYRQKNDESYQGYVTHLSETCDPENSVQLITSVQTAPNQSDDGQLLAASLDDLAARKIEITEATVDGGYNGPVAERACTRHQVTLRPTTIRGGKPASGRWGWEQYEWTQDEEGTPSSVTCPQGQTVSLQPGKQPGWWRARFARQQCTDCPFFQKECRVKPYTRKPPTLHVQLRTIQVARLRQGMSPANYAVRANIESTIHAFKHPFAAGKLPVRGVIRARMVAYSSALMVNLRRLHRYFTSGDAPTPMNPSFGLQFVLFWQLLLTFWHHFIVRRTMFVSQHNPVR